MTYTLTYNNQMVEIPNYNFSIAELIEKQELVNASKSKFKDKCRSMYSTIEGIIGCSKIEELIGKFEDCDPNEINILYLQILKTYNEPLENYKDSDVYTRLDNFQIEKLTSLVDALDKASKMKLK